MRRSRPAGRNLLDFVPVRCVDCETRDDGQTTLLRPKFVRGPLARWVQPRLRKPFYRVRLDEIGTCVWGLINGTRTVGEIAGEVERQFGERWRPSHERVSLFMRELEKGCMIRFADEDERAGVLR